ncbi:hypothetical protein LSM04_002851 [Trypanosoma melophagium]|uniref:uncharacterized protein n=1 Tax=Trypanosoma melophagium TaxID=715481 RepID=UPI00351A9432|nr:hypothetical protein LSM04_002851 [Trypanosoma melophagium]
MKQTTLWPRDRWHLGGKDGAAAEEDVTPPPSWKEGDGATPSFPYIPDTRLASLRPSRGQHTHKTVGQGHPRKPRLEHATHAPRPSRIVAEHWRWGARRARGTP